MDYQNKINYDNNIVYPSIRSFLDCQRYRDLEEIAPSIIFFKDGSCKLVENVTFTEKFFTAIRPTEFAKIVEKTYDNKEYVTHIRRYFECFNNLSTGIHSSPETYKRAIQHLQERKCGVVKLKLHFRTELTALKESIRKTNLVFRFFLSIYYSSNLYSLQNAIDSLENANKRLSGDIDLLKAEMPPAYPLTNPLDCETFANHVILASSNHAPGRLTFTNYLLKRAQMGNPLVIFNKSLKINSLTNPDGKDAVWIKKEIVNFNNCVIDFFHSEYPFAKGLLVADELNTYKDNNSNPISPTTFERLILQVENAQAIDSYKVAQSVLLASGYDSHLSRNDLNRLAMFLKNNHEVYLPYKQWSDTPATYALTKAQKSDLNRNFIQLSSLSSDQIDLSHPAQITITTVNAQENPQPHKVDFEEATTLIKNLGYSAANSATAKQFAQYLVKQKFTLTYYATLLESKDLFKTALHKTAVRKERLNFSHLFLHFMQARENQLAQSAVLPDPLVNLAHISRIERLYGEDLKYATSGHIKHILTENLPTADDFRHFCTLTSSTEETLTQRRCN